MIIKGYLPRRTQEQNLSVRVKYMTQILTNLLKQLLFVVHLQRITQDAPLCLWVTTAEILREGQKSGRKYTGDDASSPPTNSQPQGH